MAKLGAASPLLIVLDAVSAPHTSRLPDVLASKMPKCVATPQLAVGDGNVIAPLFEVAPPVPALGFVVVVAPPVDAQFVVDGARAARAYEPPDTSVPPPESLGAAVNSAP